MARATQTFKFQIGPARWRHHAPIPVPAWYQDLRAGDVLEAPSGDQRLVRVVHRSGDKLYVYFAIRICSWTRRPYTILMGTDAYLKRMRRVARLRPPHGDLDRRIVQEINCPRSERYASCCEARGIP